MASIDGMEFTSVVAALEANEKRIAELEMALDEITGASYPIMTNATGMPPSAMCVPIGAWENALRIAKLKS